MSSPIIHLRKSLALPNMSVAQDGGPKVGSSSNLVARICVHCGAEFWAKVETVRRGGGRLCSFRCCGRVGNRELRRRHPNSAGSLNPNWRGGISRNHVHYRELFRSRHPEKAAAHDAVRLAVAKGSLRRPFYCKRCGDPHRPFAHHDDYTKPLEVRWLCRRCHRIADKARIARERREKAS